MKKHLLIVGDSFAADMSCKNLIGWPNMLESHFDVVNLAQAGVGEYKILKQLESVVIGSFDAVIISHTSHARVHTKKHPTLYRDKYHANCDLIISDVYDKKQHNESMRAAWGYFKYHYDDTYYRDIYNFIRLRIDQYLKDSIVISINNFEPNSSDISFLDLYKTNKGLINHFDETGNDIIYHNVLNNLRSKLGKR